MLLIAWERKTAAEAEALGKTNLAGAEMWPTKIVEIEPVGATGGNVVWEWHLWDHLIQDTDPTKPNFGVIADHPEFLDINLGTANNGSWDHADAMDYDPARDEIILGCHRLSEVLVIDHSTTTALDSGGRCPTARTNSSSVSGATWVTVFRRSPPRRCAPTDRNSSCSIASGSAAASGVYYFQLSQNGRAQVGKAVLLK